jgi:integrase
VAVHTLAERVITEREVSAARARQLRWVAGELALALDHAEFPTGGIADIGGLLAAGPVTVYLDLAARGERRRRATVGDPRATDASMRIRADCVRLLGEAAGVLVDVAERPGMPELRDPVDAPSRGHLIDFLERRADHATAPATRVRLFAIVGVVLDTGARVGELCALRTDDLGARLTTLRLTRRPQARSIAAPTVERVRLAPGTRRALRHWLEARDELVAQVQGAATALWVSVAPNHSGTLDDEGGARRRPPGMPLRPRGLQRAYTRGVVEANAHLAGAPGWSPLPYRLEQLRRAVSAAPE